MQAPFLCAKRLLLWAIFIFATGPLLAQSDDVFGDLIYNKDKTYDAGMAVILSLEDVEVYTAKVFVPLNTPPPDTTYWKDSQTTTTEIQNSNNWNETLAELNTIKASDDYTPEKLGEAVSALVDPTEGQSAALTAKMDWFGLRFEKGNWCFHSLYGWIHLSGQENLEEFWFFIPDESGDLPASWNWTSKESFPFVYNVELEWLEFSGPEFFAMQIDPPLAQTWLEEPSGELWDLEEFWLDDFEKEPWEEDVWGCIYHDYREANDLVYRPMYFYEPGQAVITSLDDGQIFTAIEEVPWGKTYDTYSPTGPNGSRYWRTFEETTSILETENPALSLGPPANLSMQDLYSELESSLGWSDEEDWHDDDWIDLPGFFYDLLYDPLKSYPPGAAVLLDPWEGEIYLSKSEVPAGEHGEDETFSPMGSNSREYWTTSYESFLTLDINFDFMESMPRSFDAKALSRGIAELVQLEKEDLATMEALFAGLKYDPSKVYLTGEAVVLEADAGEIFIAKQKVPAAPDGSNAPDGPDGEKFWVSGFETIEDFENLHDDFWEDLPDGLDWEFLHMEVSRLSVPKDRDSDHDGISDYEELFTYKTNPATEDSDSDGLPDDLEIEFGSNPSTSDAELVRYLKGLGEEETMLAVFNNLSAYGLVTQNEYEAVKEQIEMTADTNATPYTSDWFYMPERGWMWTDKSVYPYFFDSNSSGFLYFQAGFDKPRFYDFGTKNWFNLE